MLINNSRPQVRNLSKARPMANKAAASSASVNADSFTLSDGKGANVAKGIGGMVVGAGIGVAAGLLSGSAAGVAGAITLAVPGALIGGLGTALAVEQFADNADAAKIVGGGILGAIGGGAVGIAGGALLASHVGSTGMAIGLGVVGGITGLLTNLD